MKTEQDFKNQVQVRNIEYWPIHNCSICNYQCGYHFIEGEVYYDNGCFCTNGQNLNPRSWQDLANHYNRQDRESYIDEMNDFWGFD